MKKHITILFLLLLLITALLSSCKPEQNDAAQSAVGGEYVFKSNSSISLIVSQAKISDKLESGGALIDNPEYSSAYASVATTLRNALNASSADLNVEYATDAAEKAKHEIVLGECDRELSRQAYRELENVESENGKSVFLIYSNGSSVAIAYEQDNYEIAKIAVNYFIENYLDGKSSLVLETGYKHIEKIDMLAYTEELGKASLAAQWEALESDMLSKYTAYFDDGEEARELVSDTIEALHLFYDSFDSDALVNWFANLYEPNICVCKSVNGSDKCLNTPYCGGAGFYFSNGGRDTYGFLPDLESTAQTIGFLRNSGMLDSVGGDVTSVFSDEDIAKIVKWVKAMQDPDDGYFYHPQWSKQQSQANLARIGRDLGHAVNILKYFGETPTYTTPSGVSGDGDSTLPTSSVLTSERALTMRLENSVATAVSKVVATDSNTPSYMLTEAAFRKYLGSLNIKTNSYLVGNEISSSSSQIIARDKELAAMGADYRLTDILIEWFNENQNPDTGTWHWGVTDDPYYANNGVLKIVTTYQALGREFPNALKAIDNAVNALTCDTPINHVCDLYNTWFAISFICDNLRTYGNKEAADEVVWALRERAPEAIKATAMKMSACRCEDGSYSYHPGVTSTTSQGLPVSAPTSTGEPALGDVNATVICTYGNLQYMFGALYLSGAPNICTEADRIKFKNLIAEMDQVIKNAEIDPYDPNTFDIESSGSKASYEFLTTDAKAGSSLLIEEDTREGAEGNVMRLHSGIGSWDIFVMGTSAGVGGDAFVFETDMCFSSATYINGNGSKVDVPSGWLMQLQLGSGSNATQGFYCLGARVDNGVITLMDMSSTKDGAPSSQYTELYTGLSMGEWFHIKLEYFSIDDHTARIRVYIGSTRADMTLVAVSDNYFDYYANKIDNPNATAPAVSVYASSMISVTTAYEQDILFDDLCVYRSRVNYKAEELPLNKNVDGPDQDEVKFDFGSVSEIPEAIEVLSGEGTARIENIGDTGYLTLSGGKVSIPANYRTAGSNVASLSADLLWNSGNAGETLLSVLFTEGEVRRYNVIGFDFKVKTVNGENRLVLYERKSDGTTSSAVDLVRIEKGVETNISIDFYHTENVALIYIDGEFVTISDMVYANTRPRLIDRVWIESPDGEISLNNIVFERRKFDFATAVEPDMPSDVHQFDSAESETDIIFNNVTVSDGVANLTSVISNIKVPLAKRTPLVTAHLIQAVIIPGENSGDTARLAILDENYDPIVAVTVAVSKMTDGISVKVYETGVNGKYDLVIASKMVDYGNDVEVALVWFADEKIANIEICGEVVGSTSVCYDVGVDENTPVYGAVYYVADAPFAIDDVVAESLYKYRTPITLEGDNADNGKSRLTYDYSVASNLPKAFTMSLAASGSNVRVEQALKAIGNSQTYSKALVLDSRSGGNDQFRFAPSTETSGMNRVVFETEMMISSKSSNTNTLFQIMFTDTANSLANVTYMPCLGLVDGKVVYYECSSTGKTETDLRYESAKVQIANADEWFKLRIEYYKGNDDTVRIVVTVNDGDNMVIKSNDGDITVNKLISNNYYGYRSVSNPDAAPRNDIKQVLFYAQNSPAALVYMDNTSFYGDGATYVGGDVNLIKELR